MAQNMDALMRSSFDPDKAREALTYIASKLAIDFYCALKLIYLADKAHLSQYGSQIFGDNYSAMDYGPVASGAYDAIKVARRDYRATTIIQGIESAIAIGDHHALIALREADTRYLSETDLECLNYAIETYGHMDFDALKKISHDAAYEATQRNRFIKLDAIAATLPNGPEIIQYLADPYPTE